MKPKYITDINQIQQLSSTEKEKLKEVGEWFAFRANTYYLSLIDWNNPDDPIKKIIIPNPDELDTKGTLDPSSEQTYTLVPGLQHKYNETALLLVSNMCGGFCRFCFRKRLFVDDDSEISTDISAGIEYIRNHPEITNVLLTGGDSLMLSTKKLEPIIKEIREIEHVKIIRLGSKMPAYNPFRIIDDPSLIDVLEKYSTTNKRIYVMSQFNHPNEITSETEKGIDMLLKAGVIVLNQTPIIRGVNDKPDILAKLFRKLSFIGVSPYYIFQCRPAVGNRAFCTPVEENYRIFEEARTTCSGIAKRARFVISHKSGKIEVAGVDETKVYFKYTQAAEPENRGRFFSCKRNNDATWFDDYIEE